MAIIVALLLTLLAVVTGLWVNERIQKKNILRKCRALRNELRRK